MCLLVCVSKITEEYNIKMRIKHRLFWIPLHLPSGHRAPHTPPPHEVSEASACQHPGQTYPRPGKRRTFFPLLLMLPPPSPGLTCSRDNLWSDCPFLSGETPSSTAGTGCCFLAPKTSGHIPDQYICQVGYSLFNNTMWGPLLPAKFLDLDTVSRVSYHTREGKVWPVCAPRLFRVSTQVW